MRIALGISYNGHAYRGWQSQACGQTVQDKLESALAQFAQQKIGTLCAGRTDAGVHALMQVVHFDTELERSPQSWLRGTNAFLPADIALEWVQVIPASFHCRASAVARRYVYILRESPIRPSVDANRVGWTYQALNAQAMQQAAQYLIGEHDFSAFRAAACQALSPIKNIKSIAISRRSQNSHSYWRFEFEANAFLHHMIRNIMGCLIAIGTQSQTPQWMNEVLQARNRKVAAPTFAPDGLYFMGPIYDAHWNLPQRTTAFDWLP